MKNIFKVFKIKNVTSLYIGPKTVELVVLRGSLKGPKLVKFGQIYIYPKDAGEIKESMKDDYIIEAIDRVFKETSVAKGNVISAISSEDTMVRYFQMPNIPKQEWASAINFEAKRYIPFRMEEVVSDFHVIESQSLADNMDVVFIAVKKKVVERHVRLLERAGIRPIIVEPAPFSLIRAFKASEQINSKENTTVINIDEKIASIIILRRGTPYIIRDIPLEGAGPGGDRSFEPIFEKLLAEIRLSFDFYEKQFPAEVIDKILIYSNLALEKWDELAGREFQTPVELGDPLRGIRISEEVVPTGMAVSFGLALRGISEPLLEINLCKEKLLLYRDKELFLKMLFSEASVALFVLIIVKILFIRAATPLANRLNATLAERPSLEISIKDDSIPALEAIENKMEKEKFFLENIMSSRTYFTKRLAGLAKFMPDNIWLTEMDFEETLDTEDIPNVNREFILKGYCLLDENLSEADAINNFLIDLKEESTVDEGMSSVDIVSVNKMGMYGQKVANFEIVFSGP